MAAAILAVAVVLLFVTSPVQEGFWWTDAATFALNGDLVRDYIASGLPGSPMAFAEAWFRRYPALTISLYPPIFPLAEAAMFSVFGFSHAVAQATVAAFTAAAVYGAYRMARTTVPALAAAGFALVLFSTPETLLWSRQVMMETPSLAFLLIAAAALLSYQASGQAWRLMLAVVMLLAGIYTKQTAIFAVPVFALALLADQGFRLFRLRAIWIAAVAGAVGLMPLAAFTLKFAAQTIDIALRQGSAAEDGAASHLSIDALTVYARALPGIVGWLPLLGALVFLILVATHGWRDAAEKRLTVLMLAWFAVDYAFVTLIAHFEARYGMTLAVPPAMLSVLLVVRVVSERWMPAAALAFGVALFGVSLAMNPIHWVQGYGAAAAAVLQNTKQDDVVLLDLDDTKSMVFSLRARSPQPKVNVLRAEKLLVDYSILREWGIRDRNLGTEDIEAMIDRYGISLVVLQPDFWIDQPSMARLQAVVNSNRFEQIAEFPIDAQDQHKRTLVKLFRNTRPTQPMAGVLEGRRVNP